ncbi:AraC family transcriptional regulator [Novosphingobium nitrogenifigens DSM 19370]|uniref:AraC family transcriptional regulator n=1 Tax=Novosphingobium nitrogenifigens DSM 19370 TaxID=983920 RepID=F1Z360_9SPHN|nr:GlxA family transcriptional regulator [Novosphingobium nitrogenifigens]EGD60953.1 AraC family transcriptional regulator [Novosphingobium nitrogenifigens DSM 19370]
MSRTIGLYLYDDFQLLDACGPITSFEIASRMAGDAYSIVLLSARGGAIRSSSGVALETLAASEALVPDTLIVVGGNGSREAMRDEANLYFLRMAAGKVRRLCSVCSGAFLLAGAGALDGKRATTHWRRAALLADLFPAVTVEPDRIHIRDGHVWTSAGITAGIDLALALIAQDLGEDLARAVAQDMVVYYRRPGGQSQFSALSELGGDHSRFGDLLDWMRGHLDERLTVETLAARCAMSPRNFSRAFARDMGMSPARAVERLRLDVARERVETTPVPVEQIALATGFHDPERMRRAFMRAFGQPPQAMRRLARG